jgi:dTDP-4-dehydrorhamnose 3,5-epimerase
VVELEVRTTPIPGLLVVHLPLHGDARGWFKENWQREKMTALGLPDFGPVQNNMSFNTSRGATRGIHAEPWDKYLSVATGRVHAAWVDLREGESFGTTYARELGPETAVFVPRGVGNAYQALEDGTVYSYLVNDHWRPGIAYPSLHLADETAGIRWPIPLDSDEAEVSEKDLANPRLGEVTPVRPLRTLVLGARGQVGRALADEFPDARAVGRAELDLTDPAALEAWPWEEYDVVLNAAAYTAVDAAETPQGRVAAWAANATGPAALAAIAREHRLTLVHYSSEYVFDGTVDGEHTEDEPLSPLGVYAQSKAAGELAVAAAPRHHVLRTSWVVGDGDNFVRTMRSLAERGVCPRVVDDQVGRLTFASEVARATRHLLESRAAYGVHHVSNGGSAMSWYEVARRVFELSGRPASDVVPVSTADFFADRLAQGRGVAPRPLNSALSLDRLRRTGFEPRDAMDALAAWLGA